MTEIKLGIRYLEALQKAFNHRLLQTSDEIKFSEILNDCLKKVKQQGKVDNRYYICLERFYQQASLLIGLSTLQLSEVEKQNWLAFRKWHEEMVKPNLHLYGPVII
ncbi:hypothetical protein [Enterococcus cecorum]|uniref:hypothetical protein n=1 Tax=Enterococcus cecorum TaxID=44008 RepID=UPI001FACC81B|nr:hypothetical protein [Enterococcus cecorum]MCJ0537833.1 hypothetical protein [Enterococcus cecorum]MCJ0545346.1 hypothetical protein [Enterococcus cecorum]MCJ0550907.1 hypothetical protein [Enterococcus cecorum]MCJ0569664.1 hypothetical protein [Enterococcus cecorum]